MQLAQSLESDLHMNKVWPARQTHYDHQNENFKKIKRLKQMKMLQGSINMIPYYISCKNQSRDKLS